MWRSMRGVLRMKTAIVLSTYNGEKYILPLLDSLKDQTMSPDEVLISDDGSEDDTVSIIEQYIQEHHLLNWSIKINATNRGWRQNFMSLIQRTDADLIFPCDQDDIWYPDKIASMTHVMEQNEEIQCLVSDYDIFYMDDRSGRDHKSIRNAMNDSNAVALIPMNASFIYVKRPGCTYCIRKSLKKYIVDYWDKNEDAHDAFFWRVACVMDGLYHFERKTIKYRRHADSVLSMRRRDRSWLIDQMEYYIRLTERLITFTQNMLEVENSQNKLFNLNKMIKTWQLRLQFAQGRNPIIYLKLMRYQKYYFGFRSYIRDLISVYLDR